MKKNLKNLFSSLESLFFTVPQELSQWNVDYFKGNKKRYEDIIRIVNRDFTGKSILEVGSLPCHLTFLLREMDYSVVGIDLEPARLERFISNASLDIKKCEIETESFPFKDNTFDCVLFTEVFEHLRNPLHVLEEIYRVLRRGGLLILSTPNLYYLPRFLFFLFGKGLSIDLYEELGRVRKVGHVGHIREYSKKELENVLTKTKFRIIKAFFVTYFKTEKVSFVRSIIDALSVPLPFFRSHIIFLCEKNNL